MKTTPLAKNLKHFLEEKNWTVSKFSKELEKSEIYADEKTIRNWLDGKYYPQTETLIALSEFLGVSLDELVCSDLTGYGIQKIDTLSREEKETLYKLCISSGNICFPTEISKDVLFIKPEIMTEEEFCESFRVAARKALTRERIEDFLCDLLKKDGLYNRVRKSESDTNRILNELTKEACKYLDIAIQEDDEPHEPKLYHFDKETIHQKDFKTILTSIPFIDEETKTEFPKKDDYNIIDEGTKTESPKKDDYNIIDEKSGAYNTYYSVPGVAVLTRIDFINDFGTEASSTKGLELIASAACQEERLKQQFFKSFIDKKIVGAISEGGYIQKKHRRRIFLQRIRLQRRTSFRGTGKILFLAPIYKIEI